MLGDKLKQIRKEKGITQESLAIQLHVVRQTVSKWEKNLSVPDAEMLQRISEALDTPVNTLLGADMPPEQERNEIAEQLARLNEQLAIQNRRARRIWKIVGIVLAAIMLVSMTATLLGLVTFGARRGRTMSVTINMSEDSIYSQAEVEAAVEKLQEYFREEYPAFTLLSIAYDENVSNLLREDLAVSIGYDQVIVLLADFRTDEKGTGNWNANSTYKNTEWYFGRNAYGQWIYCGNGA